MQKLTMVAISMLIVVSFLGCDKKGQDSAEEGKEIEETQESTSSVAGDSNIPEKVKRPLRMTVVEEWGTGTHMIIYANGVKAEAEKYGIEMSVIDADHDLAKMAEGIDNAINNKMDAILISHGKSDALIDAVERALKAGIPVIAFDNDFDLPEDVHKGNLTSLDQYDLMMGLLSQMNLVQELDGTGNVVYNRLANVPPTDKRHRIWQGGILPTYTGINVIKTIDLGAVNPMPKAQTALETIITTSDSSIDAVYAVWDEYAKGFYNAIVASGKTIPLYSVDISDQDLAMMQDRPDIWRSSAAVDPTIIGQVQVRLALKAIAGEKIPRYYSLKPIIVKSDDLPKDKKVTMTDLSQYYDGWGYTSDFYESWMDALAKAKM